MGEGPTLHIPHIQVEYNQKLFNLLSPLDQLVLILHEQLYALAQNEGVMHSNKVRKFVRILLFDLDIWAHSNDWGEAHGHFILRELLSSIYGDYPLFFADAIGAESNNPYFKAWIHFLKKNRRDMRTCLGESSSTAVPTGDECRDRVLNPMFNANNMTEEDAFIHALFFGLDKGARLIHSELIFSPFSDDIDSTDLQQRLLSACSLMSKTFNTEIKEIKTYVVKAQNYCKVILNNLKSLKNPEVTTEKDQN